MHIAAMELSSPTSPHSEEKYGELGFPYHGQLHHSAEELESVIDMRRYRP